MIDGGGTGIAVTVGLDSGTEVVVGHSAATTGARAAEGGAARGSSRGASRRARSGPTNKRRWRHTSHERGCFCWPEEDQAEDCGEDETTHASSDVFKIQHHLGAMQAGGQVRPDLFTAPRSQPAADLRAQLSRIHGAGGRRRGGQVVLQVVLPQTFTCTHRQCRDSVGGHSQNGRHIGGVSPSISMYQRTACHRSGRPRTDRATVSLSKAATAGSGTVSAHSSDAGSSTGTALSSAARFAAARRRIVVSK